MQAGAGDRLEQVLDDPLLDGLLDQVRVAVGRQDDDRGARVAGDLAGGREAVQARHLDVHEHHVGQRPAADLDRALAVVDDGHDVVAQRLQLALQAGGDRLLIVGDQDLQWRFMRAFSSHCPARTRDSARPGDGLSVGADRRRRTLRLFPCSRASSQAAFRCGLDKG